MKVVHLNTSRGWGGGEEQILQLMLGLRERGVSSELLARSGGELFRRVAEETDMTVLPFDFRSRHNLLAALRLRRVLTALNADLLHLHDGRAAALGLPAARGLHDLGVVIHRRVSSRMRRNPVSRARYRSARIDAYIAVSDAACRSLSDIAVGADRVHVIPSGIDAALMAAGANRDEARRDLGVCGQILVGSVGALEPKKDLLTFVRAAEILAASDPRLRFLVVGEGRERQSLERRTTAAGLGDRLRFLGHVRDAYRVIAAMDVFVFPSLREGSPGAVKEAMALGVPVVAANTPGTAEVIPDGVGVLVPPGDATRFASAIRGVLESPARSREIAQRALRRLESRYAIQDTVRRTLRLYEDVVEARARNTSP